MPFVEKDDQFSPDWPIPTGVWFSIAMGKLGQKRKQL
jgi:hypothetical protein